MAKTKETPWTDRKMMYKDGNVDVYRYFNWETWKRMTADERAMWTESSEATPAPISKEVIDFKKKEAEKSDKIVKPKSKATKLSIEALSKEYRDSLPKEHLTEEEQKDAIKKILKKRGIRFTHNSKLETLQKKLTNADNPE